jgi:hypothetical protein
MLLFRLLFAVSLTIIFVKADDPPKTIQQLLDEAKVHLTGGQLNEALNCYDKAIGKL